MKAKQDGKSLDFFPAETEHNYRINATVNMSYSIPGDAELERLLHASGRAQMAVADYLKSRIEPSGTKR